MIFLLLCVCRPAESISRWKHSVQKMLKRRSTKGKSESGQNEDRTCEWNHLFVSRDGVVLSLQELSASGDQEGPVCSGEAGSSAHGRDHQTVPDVGQTSAPGGLAGQRGDQPAHTWTFHTLVNKKIQDFILLHKQKVRSPVREAGPGCEKTRFYITFPTLMRIIAAAWCLNQQQSDDPVVSNLLDQDVWTDSSSSSVSLWPHLSDSFNFKQLIQQKMEIQSICSHPKP